MSGGSHDVKAVVEGVRVDTAGDEAGDMGHVGHKQTAGDFGADLSDAGKIRDFHKSGVTDEDDFGLFGKGFFLEFGVVNITIGGNAIADEVVDLSGAGDR